MYGPREAEKSGNERVGEADHVCYVEDQGKDADGQESASSQDHGKISVGRLRDGQRDARELEPNQGHKKHEEPQQGKCVQRDLGKQVSGGSIADGRGGVPYPKHPVSSFISNRVLRLQEG
jgi:hypothetical protein